MNLCTNFFYFEVLAIANNRKQVWQDYSGAAPGNIQFKKFEIVNVVLMKNKSFYNLKILKLFLRQFFLLQFLLFILLIT